MPCWNTNRNRRNRRRDTEGMIFEDPEVRRRFIFMVLLIVALNLVITTLVSSLAVFHRPTRMFFRIHWWLFLIVLCILLPISIMLCYCRKLFRMSPCKYILLALYVFAHTLMVCLIVSRYHPKWVLMAFGICAGMVILLALFARFAPCDFTGCCTLVFVLCILLGVLGILGIFFRELRLLYYGFGILSFSIFLVIDIQLLIGGKTHQEEFDEKDYIIAAMQIYGDIIRLFIYLLECIGLLGGD